MSRAKSPQLLKPATAAQKLGIYLPAAPESFRETPISREQLNDYLQNPPEWMLELKKHGPHPRAEVAHKLGISNSGLARSGVDGALTTAEISALLTQPPEWLVRERATQAAVHEENARVKAERAAKAAST